MLGRARRTVVVIDAGSPRNRDADAVHNLCGQEGVAPGRLLARGRQDVSRYGVEIVPGEVAEVRRDGAHTVSRTASGDVLRARAVVLATGVVEDLPAVAGLAALWGRDVVSCPYCHGWEARDKAVAVLGTGPRAWRQVLLMRRYTEDLALLGNGPAGLDDQQLEYVRRTGIAVEEQPVARVRSEDGHLAGIELADGTVLARDVVFAATTRRQPSGLAAELGCLIEVAGVGTDPAGRTSVPGVWAVGSATDPSLTIAGSAGHATGVAIAINDALVDEDLALALRS
ncbi:NAD(P)/FAD-dependent oxidoreductase [Pseudonocardia adelaidensis]|uniref:NAD(P)/FAD-dependent oxidoreductase n=1 Tax=Pseudonocardia adelaidensis TaxID=648754 RepID=A0ABP9NX34_9PSEU